MLQRIAACGGVIAIGGAIFFTEKIQGNFRQQEYFQKSLMLLQNYGPAKQSFGEPISTRKLDLGDTAKNCVDGFNARLTVPLKGPKGKGTLHSWASRKTTKDSWEVDRLDMEIEKSGQIWTFYQRKKDQDSDTSS